MRKRFGLVGVASALLASVGMTALAIPASGAEGTPDAARSAPRPAADSAVAQARQALRQHSAAALRSPRDEFKVLTTLRDPSGATHVRMRRVYRGIPVIGGQVIVHNGPSGQFNGVTTTIDHQLNLGTEPSVPAQRARDVASRVFEGTIETVRRPHLVIDVSGQPVLAWETVVVGTGPDGQTPSKLHVTVNAKTAEVVASWNQVQTAEGRGEGTYNGQVTFYTTRSGGGYRMVDQRHGGGTTYNADNGSQVYTDRDNVWPDGEAVDVHYGVGKTYDYFAETFGFEGPTGDGSGIPRNVHIKSYDYCNAFYNGRSINFGDCGGNPFTGIDVAAHEFTHGVTDNTAGLRYNNADSGGLNEATSDIFATLVEFYANSPGDEPDYLIGETIGDVFGRKALRYMYEPTLNPRAYGCYEPGRRADPHFTSGVANHFFYLLVQGSDPANYPSSPTCNGATIEQGIGNAKGGQIWFRALSRYMGPSETYPEAAEATARAAADLYGTCGVEYQRVQAAWAAVGIGDVGRTCEDPPQDPGQPSAEFAVECLSSEPSCSFDASGSADDGSIVSYAWEFGDGATGSGVSPSHTYAEAGTYTVTLTVTDDEGNSDTATREVRAGTPPAGDEPQAGFTVRCRFRSGCTFDASGSTDDRGIAGYSWEFGDGATDTGRVARHRYSGGGSYTVTLTVTDEAGQTDTAQRRLRCYDFGTSAFCFPR